MAFVAEFYSRFAERNNAERCLKFNGALLTGDESSAHISGRLSAASVYIVFSEYFKLKYDYPYSSILHLGLSLYSINIVSSVLYIAYIDL
jgi:hypothetical protein